LRISIQTTSKKVFINNKRIRRHAKKQTDHLRKKKKRIYCDLQTAESSPSSQ
jgi:hypothetical protein